MDTALAEWIERVGDVQAFDETKIVRAPSVSETEKWRYWRCGLADGSRLSVNIQTKPDGQKSMLAINHDNLASSEAVEAWRQYWKAFLA